MSEAEFGGPWTVGDHEEMPFFDEALAGAIRDLAVPPCRSVIDIGCGLGRYLEFLSDSMAGPLLGIEPLISVDAGRWRVLAEDVTFGPPRDLGHFDLVLCLEVTEHVAMERHKALFDAIAARTPRLIVFSGAVPGQTGYGHIACRAPGEWADEFAIRRFHADPFATVRLRTAACFDWFKDNLMVFRPGR
jgi:SAM-dependent methyltransferase